MTSGRYRSGGRVGRRRPCARVVLACTGLEIPPVDAAARELRVAVDTVRMRRRRFLAEQLDGLVDEPRAEQFKSS